MKGLVYLTFTAYFWLLIWGLGLATCVQLLHNFGMYFMLIEYLKSYFMVIGGIVLIFALVSLPATVTGASVVLGLILGFFYVFVRSLLEKSYQILRYGPPQKQHQVKKNRAGLHKQSENYQWQNESQYSRAGAGTGGQYTHEQAHRTQENPKQEQPRQEQERQSHDKKPHVDMPATLEEACAVLGTEPGLDIAVYKKAWKQEALRYHPDKTRELGERLQQYAEVEMKRINKAWEIIKNAA